MFILFFSIFSLALLILVHEWGHFWAARLLGVRVQEFGFGFPPRLISRTKNNVRYSLNLLPLGGFVKIFGEQGEGAEEPDSFSSRPIAHRALILAAGVLMNIAAAWLFFSISVGIGLPRIANQDEALLPVSIIEIAPHSPAEQAGLRPGDRIRELRSAEIAVRPGREEDVIDFIQAYRGEKITLVVVRGEERREIQATPRGSAPEGEGPLGIALARLTVQSVPWYWIPVEGLAMLGSAVLLTLRALAGIIIELIRDGTTAVPLSGPIGIFFVARDTSAFGIASLMQFVGLLSVNLAILNALPIPALDGGRMALLAFEKIRGARLSIRTENMIHAAGFAFLVALMILVTYRDIVRIF
ncbi:MAG: site-2 protease family protein [Candidatus Sungbacteria bacterium]|nr:site-2 protease family protein [Candidatus Sungbacteria bacterium]